MAKKETGPGSRGEAAAPFARWSLGATEVRTILAAFLGVAGSVTMFTHVSPIFLEPVSTEFGWGMSTYPLLQGSAALVSALLTPLIGRGIDRLGMARFILIGVLGYGGALVGAAFSHSVAMLWLSHFVMVSLGIGSGTVAYSKLITLVFADGRGKASGILLGCAGALGATALIPITNHMVQAYGWRTGYLGLGAIQFAVAMLGYFLAPLGKVNEAPSAGKPSSSRRPVFGFSSAQTKKTLEFWLFLASTFFLALANTAVRIHAFPLLKARGFDANAAAAALGMVPIAQLFAAVGVGVCLDRWQTPRIAIPFFACSALGIGLVGVANQATMATAGMLLIGFSMGCELAVASYIISRQFGTRCFAETFAWITAGIKIALGLGPYLMGLGPDLAGGYGPALVGAFVIAAASAALLLAIPSYRFGLNGEALAPIAADPAAPDPSVLGLEDRRA